MSTDSKRIVLISGANQGIGYEAVKQLSQVEGLHIYLGCRSLEKGEAAAASIQAIERSTIEPLELDITSATSIKAAAEHIQAEHGCLDVLINNAGLGVGHTAADLSNLREAFVETYAVNVASTVSVTEACLPLLRASKQDPTRHPRRIIFVSSAVGSITKTLDPGAFRVSANPVRALPYKASKAALNLVMAQYSTLLRDEPFEVNSCTPGLCATAFSGGIGRDPAQGAKVIFDLATGEIRDKGGFWEDQHQNPF